MTDGLALVQVGLAWGNETEEPEALDLAAKEPPRPRPDEWQEFKLSPEKRDEVEKKLRLRAGRIAKLGLTPDFLEWSWGEPVATPIVNKRGVPTGGFLEQIPLRMREKVLKLGGWRLLGRLEASEGGTMVYEKPGEAVPVSFRDGGHRCAHCKTSRRRLATFVVEHDDGRQAEIGRNCLADFLGHSSAAFWMFENEEIESEAAEEDALGGYGRLRLLAAVGRYLATVSALVRQDGYVSRKQAEERSMQSTSEGAWDQIFPGLRPPPKVPVTEADYARAKAIVAWAAELLGTSTYEHNLKVLAAKELVGWKEIGLLASAVVAYDRAQDRIAEMAARRPSEHVGAVKERRYFVATLTTSIYLDGMYPATLLIFRTLDGDVLSWKASGSVSHERQHDYLLFATVKGHDEYKGTKQTKISRADVMAELGPVVRGGMVQPAHQKRRAAVLGALATFEGGKPTAKRKEAFYAALRAAQETFETEAAEEKRLEELSAERAAVAEELREYDAMMPYERKKKLLKAAAELAYTEGGYSDFAAEVARVWAAMTAEEKA